MHKLSIPFVFLASAAIAAAAGTPVNCETVIVGGGAGGLHTLFRLAPKLRENVCLVEKETRLGGRIYDIAKDQGGPVYGAGALRVMEGQTVLFKLAAELGITLVEAPNPGDKVSARGLMGPDSEAVRSAYRGVSDDEVALYDLLRFGPERERAGEYPDFRSYVRKVAGEEGYQFLADVFRFRGDFTYPLSAKAYLEFLDEEWDVCCNASYPVGGMSQFITRMEQQALRNNARIFKGEPVSAIERRGDGRYTIATANYEFRADRLVIAVDAEGLKRIGGTVANEIKAQPQFQDLVGIKVVTVTQWWPSAWWEAAGIKERRAWTTQHCFNALEIPVNEYAANQRVTRSVYDDSLGCTQFWEVTAQRGTAAVEAEIQRGLAHMYPGVNIPNPVKTQVQVWPAGWYFVRAGSPYSNADIAEWALKPLEKDQVILVGDSYNPQRAAWSDAAYKSSINALNAHFGMNLETGAAAAKKHARRRNPMAGRR